MTSSGPALRYRLFGLTIASDLDCPELSPGVPGTPPDLTIVAHPAEVPGRGVRPKGTRERFELTIDDVARYVVERGDTIHVHPAPDADPGDVRLFLLGSAMGAALHQRGALPLHACAVAVGGAAYAFCGHSGAGKSTLAAALHRRGLPILSDDTGLAVADAQRGALFHPGFPRIKLWQDALRHFAIDTAPLPRDQSRLDRFQLLLRDGFHAEPLPFRGLYDLRRGEPAIVEQPPRATLGLLVEHTYRRALVRRIGSPAGHLAQVAGVAQAIRGFAFTRPWDLARFDASVDMLVDHLHRQAA